MSTQVRTARTTTTQKSDGSSKSRHSKHRGRKNKKKKLTLEESSLIEHVQNIKPDWDRPTVTEFIEKHNWVRKDISASLDREFEFDRPSHNANQEEWNVVTKKPKKTVKEKFDSEKNTSSRHAGRGGRGRGGRTGFTRNNGNDDRGFGYRGNRGAPAGRGGRGRGAMRGRGRGRYTGNVSNANYTDNGENRENVVQSKAPPASDAPSRQPLTEQRPTQPRVPAAVTQKTVRPTSKFVGAKSFASIMAPKPVVVAKPTPAQPAKPPASVVKAQLAEQQATEASTAAASSDAQSRTRPVRPPRTGTRSQAVSEAMGPSGLHAQSAEKVKVNNTGSAMPIGSSRGRRKEWRKKKDGKTVDAPETVATTTATASTSAPVVSETANTVPAPAQPRRAPMTSATKNQMPATPAPTAEVVMPNNLSFDRTSAPTMQFGFQSSSSFPSEPVQAPQSQTAPVQQQQQQAPVSTTPVPTPVSTVPTTSAPVSKPVVTNVVNDTPVPAPTVAVAVETSASTVSEATPNTAAAHGQNTGYDQREAYMYGNNGMQGQRQVQQQQQAYMPRQMGPAGYSSVPPQHSMPPMDPSTMQETPAAYGHMDNHYQYADQQNYMQQQAMYGQQQQQQQQQPQQQQQQPPQQQQQQQQQRPSEKSAPRSRNGSQNRYQRQQRGNKQDGNSKNHQDFNNKKSSGPNDMSATGGRGSKRGSYNKQQGGFFNEKTQHYNKNNQSYNGNGAPAGFKNNKSNRGNDGYQQQQQYQQQPQGGFPGKQSRQAGFKPQATGAPAGAQGSQQMYQQYNKKGSGAAAQQPPQGVPPFQQYNNGVNMGYAGNVGYFPPTMYPYQYAAPNQYPPGFGGPYGARSAYTAYNYPHSGPFPGAPDGQYDYGYDPKHGMYPPAAHAPAAHDQQSATPNGTTPAVANNEQNGTNNEDLKQTNAPTNQNAGHGVNSNVASSTTVSGATMSKSNPEQTTEWDQQQGTEEQGWDASGAHGYPSGRSNVTSTAALYGNPYPHSHEMMMGASGTSTGMTGSTGAAATGAPQHTGYPAHPFIQQHPGSQQQHMMHQNYNQDYSWNSHGLNGH